MPDLRDMQLLAALARQGHFARAADECGISQPAFSARIRNHEIDLRVAVVNRGNRFTGFTVRFHLPSGQPHRRPLTAHILACQIPRQREWGTGSDPGDACFHRDVAALAPPLPGTRQLRVFP